MLARCRRTRSEALREVREAESANPVDAFEHKALGYVLQALGDDPGAVDAWTEAHLAAPGDPEIHLRLASRLHVLGRQASTREGRDSLLQTSRLHAEHGLTLHEPEHYEWNLRARYLLARICRDLGDDRRAIAHLKLVEEDDAAAPVARVLIGDAQFRLGHYDLAERSYRESFKRLPAPAHGETAPVAEGAPREPSDGATHLTSWGAEVTFRIERPWLLSEVRARAHLGLAMSIAERGGKSREARESLRAAAAEIKGFPVEAAAARIHSGEELNTRLLALRGRHADCAGWIELRRAARSTGAARIRRVEAAHARLSEAIALHGDPRIYAHLATVCETLADMRSGNEARALLEQAQACSLKGLQEHADAVRRALVRPAPAELDDEAPRSSNGVGPDATALPDLIGPAAR